jgi:hypothetical protein
MRIGRNITYTNKKHHLQEIEASLTRVRNIRRARNITIVRNIKIVRNITYYCNEHHLQD